MGLSVYKDHTLPEVVALELLLFHLGLDREADRLASDCLLNVDPLVMDALHLYRVELALLVWTKQEGGARHHSTCQQGSSHDNSNTAHLVKTVDQKLDRVSLEPELAR